MPITPQESSDKSLLLCEIAPVIPVLAIEDPASAAPLAQALVRGGLPVLEVTLRSDAALEAIEIMARQPGAIVGAGTVLTPAHVQDIKAAGAQFAVSPGATDRLLSACEENDMPLLPGAATATEAMTLLERGYHMQKFFPAEAAGGAPALRAIGAPLPQITFCPTGGISPANVTDYLALKNTRCVGGSWVAPKALIQSGDWQAIEKLARAAANLAR